MQLCLRSLRLSISQLKWKTRCANLPALSEVMAVTRQQSVFSRQRLIQDTDADRTANQSQDWM
jgi:hypothetical protein